MEQEHVQESPGQGLCAALLADAPWHAKSFIAASAALVAGLASWIADYSSPAAARIAGSYVGGFFIGWAFRRFVKAAALVTGGLLVSMAMLKNMEWIDIDWAGVETQISHGLSLLHQGAEGLKQTLSGYLPSAGAAAAGMFFGFRKK
ncbi:MAG TPA: FUN14 domain-containing protein [Nitrospira sp.]|nr:FUN14 domain-containing protein [Nitrospira sp.]